MRISFGLNSSNSVLSFVNERMIRPLTSKEKTILAVVVAALSCLAAYLIYRQWNKGKNVKSHVIGDIPPKPKNDPALHAFMTEMVKLGEENKFEEIIARCQEVLTSDPQHKEALNRYLYALDKLGKQEEVAAKGKEILEIDPENAFCLDIYTRNQCLLGHLEEAASAYANYLKCVPDNDVAMAFYGDVLLQQEKYDEAEKQFQCALKINPESAYTLSHYAELLRRQGKLFEAKSMIDKALAFPASSWNVETLTCHAMILQDLGKNDEALKAFEKANKVDSKHPDLMKKFAQFLEQQGKHDESQAKLKEVQQIEFPNAGIEKEAPLSNEENTEEALCKQGDALMCLSKYDEAALIYEKLVGIKPGNMEYRVRYGKCLDGSGQRLKNAEMIAQAVTTYPFETTTLVMYTEYAAKYKTEDQKAFAALGNAPIDQIKQTILEAQELPSSSPSTAEQTVGAQVLVA